MCDDCVIYCDENNMKEHIHYSQNIPLACYRSLSSHPFLNPSLPQVTTDLVSVTIDYLMLYRILYRGNHTLCSLFWGGAVFTHCVYFEFIYTVACTNSLFLFYCWVTFYCLAMQQLLIYLLIHLCFSSFRLLKLNIATNTVLNLYGPMIYFLSGKYPRVVWLNHVVDTHLYMFFVCFF